MTTRTLQKSSEDISGEINGLIEERECPTPLPENVYICAECNIGFKTNNDVEIHMVVHHTQITLGEKICRLETELRLEKNQHQDHLVMLEETLREATQYRKCIEELEASKINKDAEIEGLKQVSNVVKLENIQLKNEITEKDKQFKKSTDKHTEEAKMLKKKNMETSEVLRLAVLERENLRENDRILMNTLDMMKIYVDQIKNKEGIVEQTTFNCDLCQCRLTTDQDLRKHMESKHNKWQKAKDNMPEEDILFCCTTCKFETIEEKNLTDHIKDKHNHGK